MVGLGNQEITADSLGPRAVSGLHMTRHVIREYGLKSNAHMKMHQISGIAPGVMAQTGMETLEIVQGVVSETKPDVVIAIDALAARSTARLNRTIQITDTGISPGSGVGNHREGLNEENLSVRVIGIGVPSARGTCGLPSRCTASSWYAQFPVPREVPYQIPFHHPQFQM